MSTTGIALVLNKLRLHIDTTWDFPDESCPPPNEKLLCVFTTPLRGGKNLVLQPSGDYWERVGTFETDSADKYQEGEGWQYD